MVTTWRYFVCQCDAKWFAPLRETRCPRCSRFRVSNIRLTPPWLGSPAVPEQGATQTNISTVQCSVTVSDFFE
jgi:hypothetical protein